MVWFLIGPTASGKTALAVELASRADAEIVSADSRQVYRGMDIGTAKPSAGERAAAVHHLIDVTDPQRPISAAEYKGLALAAVGDIRARGRRPLVVGGTGMYVRALIRDYNFGAVAGDPDTRRRIEDRVQARGSAELWRELEGLDPRYAAAIHPNDARRIVRALEIIELSGEIPSRAAAAGPPDYEYRIAGLDWPRKKLYQRIDQRVRAMIESGFVAEVKNLMRRGLAPDLKPLKGIGYGAVMKHLEGELDLEEAIRLTQRDTRRFAKRQITYFRALPEVAWFDPCEWGGELTDGVLNFFSDPR